MVGISAFANGVPASMFKALAETDEEGEALHNLHKAREGMASGSALDGMEPEDFTE